MRFLVGLSAALFLSTPLMAQTEDALRQHFEGKLVRVLMDMPATKDGVDIYPERARPVDYDRYARRIRRNGIAIFGGQTVTRSRTADPRDPRATAPRTASIRPAR